MIISAAAGWNPSCMVSIDVPQGAMVWQKNASTGALRSCLPRRSWITSSMLAAARRWDFAGMCITWRWGPPKKIFIYGHAPRWLANLPTNGLPVLRSTRLFKTADLGIEPLAAEPDGNHILSLQNWTIRASTPERAIIEALDELPENESFHNIDTIFEGLTTLRPRRITELLTDCTKVQVKRLFFVFADRHDHPWLKHIDRSNIDLGSGDRSFIKGGKLHPTYRITIPEEYLPGKPESAGGP